MGEGFHILKAEGGGTEASMMALSQSGESERLLFVIANKDCHSFL